MPEGYAVKVRPEKAEAVEKIKAELEASQAAVVTEYRGLTVQQLAALRAKLAEAESSYKVNKNTLVRIAVNELGFGDLVELLEGPTAVAFVKGDPIAAAKVLATFAKENPALVIKGAVLDGRVLSENETKDLATVDPIDVSRAKIAGMLVAPLQQIVMLLEAPTARILYVLDELAKRGGAEVSAPTSEAAADDAHAEAEAPAEAEAVTEAPAETEAVPDEAPAAEAPAQTSTEQEATPETTTEATEEGAES